MKYNGFQYRHIKTSHGGSVDINTIEMSQLRLSRVILTHCKLLAESVTHYFLEAGVAADDVPAEKARLDENGDLIIFIIIPNGTEVGLVVPDGEWAMNCRLAN